MAKRKRKSDEKDKYFFWTMVIINRILTDWKPRFRPLSSRWNRALGQADRDTLFSIIANCVRRLID